MSSELTKSEILDNHNSISELRRNGYSHLPEIPQIAKKLKVILNQLNGFDYSTSKAILNEVDSIVKSRSIFQK